MNVFSVTGRLAHNISIYATPSKSDVAFLCVAVKKNIKNLDGTYDVDFIECETWRQTAISASKYLEKGDLILIQGHIKTAKKYNVITGHNDMEICLVADRIEVLCKAKKQNSQNGTL